MKYTMHPLVRSAIVALVLVAHAGAPAHAASNLQPAPKGSAADAPEQYTSFNDDELTRGFIALAFGSDLHIGNRKPVIRRLTQPAKILIENHSRHGRPQAMSDIVKEYADKNPALPISLTTDPAQASIVIRLIDENGFAGELAAMIGKKAADALIAKTDAQCMTNVQSTPEGEIQRAHSLIIVDQGEDVFRDCAYHELLHVFGLPNHDQTNPWTTLNQERMVGYLSVYDQWMLALLYSPAIKPGMSPAEARAALPAAIKDLRAKMP